MVSLDELLQMNEYDRIEYLYEEAERSGKRLNSGYEEFIKINPEYAYFYARDIIKSRWKEAEKYILRDPLYAYLYARDVIRGEWKEAEKVIKQSDIDLWSKYIFLIYTEKNK